MVYLTLLCIKFTFYLFIFTTEPHLENQAPPIHVLSETRTRHLPPRDMRTPPLDHGKGHKYLYFRSIAYSHQERERERE